MANAPFSEVAGYDSVICGTAEAVPFRERVLIQGLEPDVSSIRIRSNKHLGFLQALVIHKRKFEEVNDVTEAESAISQRREDLERFEFMMGAERGRLAVTLDMLTDALILIGQHGVYCASTRNPAKPALDLEAVLGQVGGAKELIQSVMEQLRLKGEQATER